MKAVAIGLCFSFLSACVFADEADDMAELAARAKQVARAVHFTAQSASVPAELDGEALVERAAANDPATLAALSNHYVTALRAGKATVLLVCDKQRDRALVEDAGCTQAVDRHRWQDQPATACAFTLNPVATCPPR